MTAETFADELQRIERMQADAAVLHIVPVADRVYRLAFLASKIRGAGRATMTAIIEAADRHGVTLQLLAQPQHLMGDGKLMTPDELEAFYADFGFVVTQRDERYSILKQRYSAGFAQMERTPR